MTGRHEFVPTHTLSQTDCEEVSNYDHAAQLKAHHEANLAGRTAMPGEHKGERAIPAPIQKARALGRNVVDKFHIPTTIHH